MRFGIICHGSTISAWKAVCLKKLLSLDNVELVLLIIINKNKKNSIKEGLQKGNGKYLLWYLYNHLCIKRFSSSRPIDVSDALKTVPRIYCKPLEKGNFSVIFSDSDISTIKNYNLDFILRFAIGKIIKGRILKTPKYGVWSYHCGDDMKYRGRAPGFWEIYNNDNESGVILQRLTEKLDAGIILKKKVFETIDTSYKLNRDRLHFSSAIWPAEVCEDILYNRADYVNTPPSPSLSPIYNRPTNRQLIVFLLKIMQNRIKGFFSLKNRMASL